MPSHRSCDFRRRRLIRTLPRPSRRGIQQDQKERRISCGLKAAGDTGRDVSWTGIGQNGGIGRKFRLAGGMLDA